jgi:Dyp-type peroxidase family
MGAPDALERRHREPLLTTRNIQGNIIPGFNKDHVRLLFLRIGDRDAAKKWISEQVDHIATAYEVLTFNRLFDEARDRRGGLEGTVKSTWINIAFSHRGLQQLVPMEADRFRDAAFRSSRPDGAVADWVVGGPNNEADIVVIVAADDARDAAATASRLKRKADLPQGVRASGVHVVREERGVTRRGKMSGHEHFGWLDGVSQPGIRGRASRRRGDLVTPLNHQDPNQGLPGQDLLWPGEFVFGYQGQDRRRDVEAPGSDSLGTDQRLVAPAWAKDGSYLVFRRLRQDVGAFHQFLCEEGVRLGVSPVALGARLVGRWPSGAPLVLTPLADELALGADKNANNDFEYGPSDPNGLLCPFSAHIRKAYPRDERVAAGDANPYQRLHPRRVLGERDTQTHRMLRRGIPYGRSSRSRPHAPVDDDVDRGLLFMAYMTSITDQFEFVMQNLFNDRAFKKPLTGVDPLVGAAQRGDPRGRIRTVLPGRKTSVQISLQNWVTTTGGGYFFAPSISALRHLAT